MALPASLRTLAWIALLAIAPGVIGPGAVGATLAAIASFEDDHAHYVAIQQDIGHDDFVICHDARETTTPADVAFAPAGCADDHRFHAANAESLVSRHDGANVANAAPLALTDALPLASIPSPAFHTFASSDSATFAANRHKRTVVLRV